MARPCTSPTQPQNIYTLDFDSASGSMSNKRVFFSTADMGEDAVLDGHCIDEGYIGQQFMAKAKGGEGIAGGQGGGRDNAARALGHLPSIRW